jgi:hypothetical protein
VLGGSWGKHWSQGSSLLHLIDLLEQVKATSIPQMAMWQVDQTAVSLLQYIKVSNLADVSTATVQNTFDDNVEISSLRNILRLRKLRFVFAADFMGQLIWSVPFQD